MRVPLRHPAVWAVSGVSLLLLAACGGPASAKPPAAAPAGAPVPVVASTNVYGDIVRQIGGDRVQVTSFITDPAQDPHSFEADTRNQLALSRARLIVRNGGGYDDFVDTMRQAAGGAPAEMLDAVQISGHVASPGEELNEHVWYDFPAMAKLAGRIATALGRADPAHAAAFTADAESFEQKLRPLEDQEADIAAAAKGESVAITEPVPLYLLQAAGLRNATPEAFSEAIEEGDDVSPRVLRETLALFSGRKVAALVYNEQTSGPQTEQIEQAAERNGVPVVPVTETLPPGKDYLGWMAGNLDALRKAVEP